MKVCLAGTGAFGIKHLEAMAKIPGVEVISLVGSSAESAREVAQQWKIPHWTGNLAESLALPGLDAVILSTPTQMHAAQGEQCMRAGKHVMIEIPMADSLADSDRVAVRTGLGGGHACAARAIEAVFELQRHDAQSGGIEAVEHRLGVIRAVVGPHPGVIAAHCSGGSCAVAC